MTEKQILESLCNYDPRNPTLWDIYDPEDAEAMVEDFKDRPEGYRCYCHNCFYGITPFANIVLELQKKLGIEEMP